jgi:hypothetical protein
METSNGVEMDESPTLGALASALSKAQGEMRVALKDSKNPHLGSSYADLSSVWAACRKPLADNGLALLQPVTTTADGVIVETLLVHSSGEFLRRRLAMRIEVKVSREGKSQPWTWAFGSAVSYARRYSLASMLGIATGDDDDGAAAIDHTSAPAPVQQPASGSRTAKVREQLAAKQAREQGPAVVPFGKHKGKPIGELTIAELDWYSAKARESVADPAKDKFRAKEEAWLAVLESERARRDVEPPPPTEADFIPEPPENLRLPGQ